MGRSSAVSRDNVVTSAGSHFYVYSSPVNVLPECLSKGASKTAEVESCVRDGLVGWNENACPFKTKD